MSDISVRQMATTEHASSVEAIAQALGRTPPPPAISVRELARCSRNVSWENYPQTESLAPTSICVPESLEDLVAIIRNAEGRGQHVHAFGSKYSFSDCAMTTDCMVDTTQLNQPIQTVQKAMIRGDRALVAHVQAGITIKDLYTELGGSSPSLAIQTMGGASGQTLAGAISTGTHGGDKSMPPLADGVLAIHLVGAGGTQYWIEPSLGITNPALIPQWVAPGIDPANIIYDDNTFDAVLVSLGCMGVIYALVLQVLPQYDLIETTIATTWERFLDTASAYLTDPGTRFLQVAVSPYPDSNIDLPGNAGDHLCLVTTRIGAPAIAPLNGTAGRPLTGPNVKEVVTQMVNLMGIVQEIKLQIEGAFGDDSVPIEQRFVNLVETVLTQAGNQRPLLVDFYPQIMWELWPPTQPGLIPIGVAPPVVSRSPGHINVFPIFTNNAATTSLWTSCFDGLTWGGYSQLELIPKADAIDIEPPCVVSWGPNRIDVFVQGTDRALWTKSWDGANWTSFVQLGPQQFAGPPAAVCRQANQIDLFVQGTDNTLWTNSWNGTAWSGYQQLGTQQIASRPAVVSWGPNRMDVFVLGTDNTVWTKSWNGTAWSGYQQLGTQAFASAPVVVSWGPNRIDVFVLGTDNALWTNFWNGTAWSGYQQLAPQTFKLAPAVVSWGPNRIDVFVQGTDNALWTKSWNGVAWSNYMQLGPQPIVGPPTAVCWEPESIAVFVAGTPNGVDILGAQPNTGLWVKFLSNGIWSEDYLPVGTPLRGFSYSIMDTTYGVAPGSPTGSYSLEFFFPAADANGLNASVIGFVNDAINAINAATDTLLLGYISLRFTGKTRATLGMEQWSQTCAVEIAVLQGVQNELQLMTTLLGLAYNHGGLPHWGQMLDQGIPMPAGAGSIHPGYAAWRAIYAKMSSNFTIRTFENALSVRWMLTTPTPAQ